MLIGIVPILTSMLGLCAYEGVSLEGCRLISEAGKIGPKVHQSV